jgi:hypothetical protein
MPPRCLRPLVAVACAALVVACASTTIQDQWADPNFRGAPLRSFVVLGAGSDAVTRRIFEDTMVAKLRASGVSATQAYLTIPDGPMATEAQIDAAVGQAKADALMMTRMRGVQTQTQVSTVMVPGPGPGFGPGWYGLYSAWYPVQQVSQYQIAIVETSVFATANRTLVWTGVTQTFNPQSVAREAPGFADVIIRALAAQGLLPLAK